MRGVASQDEKLATYSAVWVPPQNEKNRKSGCIRIRIRMGFGKGKDVKW